MGRQALSADEIIELGQEGPPEGVPQSALAEIRGIIDAWNARFSKEVTGIIARQSRLARGESVIAVWGRELAAIGSLAAFATANLPVAFILSQLAQLDDGEQWEATRRLSFRMLNESQKFAQQYGNYFTDDQFRLSNMLDQQLLQAVKTAEQFAKAIRPDLIRAVDAFEKGVIQVFVDVAKELGEVLKKIGLVVITLPGAALGLLEWIKENIGAVLVVGGLTAAAVLGVVLYTTLKPVGAVVRRAA